MLTEQEIMNNAFKEMLAHEESVAKKYADLSRQITTPKHQQMLKGMEQDARKHYSTLLQAMSKQGIV
jgi:hypothetical protein